MDFAGGPSTDGSFAALTACREYFGYLPAIYRAQSAMPGLVQAQIELEAAILYEDSVLTQRQKERLLFVLASAERDITCATVHYELLRLLGEQESEIVRLVNSYRACVPQSEADLYRFALDLAAAEIEELKCSGRSEAILEAIHLTGWYRFVSCVCNGLAVPADFPPAPIPFPGRDAHEPFNAASGSAEFPAELPGDQFPGIFTIRDLYGFVPRVFCCQASRPGVIRAQAGVLEQLFSAEGHLSRVQKEQIVVAVSAANRNLYFVTVHSEVLSALGVSQQRIDRIVQDHQSAGLDEPDLELLNFAIKLATEPSELSAEDRTRLRSRAFTEEQIIEAVITTGITKFLNTVQFGIGTVPDFKPRIALPPKPQKRANLFEPTHRPTDEGLAFDPDADAVAKVRSGDSDAFEILVNRHSRRVYRTLLGILGSPDEACDAMQETFLKAYQHLDRFEGRSKFSTWLTSIAANTGMQVLRDRKPLQSLDDDLGDGDESTRPRQVRAWTDNPEQLYSKSETRALVEQGVLRLPAKYRMVLMLRDIEQLSIEEAAAALNLGIPALKSRHLRGRLMLREALTPHFAVSAKGGTA